MVKSLAHKIKGLSADEAIKRLALVSTKGARMLSRVVESALANATKNSKLDKTLLKIKSVEIFKGSFFKRWQPVSRGSAHQIQKRTTHIKVTLYLVKSQNSKVKSK